MQTVFGSKPTRNKSVPRVLDLEMAFQIVKTAFKKETVGLVTREHYVEKRVNIRTKTEEEEKEKLLKLQQEPIAFHENQLTTMVLPRFGACVSSTHVCVSSGGCVSSDKVCGVTTTGANVSKGDAMGSVAVFLRRPVFVLGTMLLPGKYKQANMKY
ncbi:Protein XAP5 CIRCADIAN TIMEKEEPER [Camellia lanceoleosa]|uniref:Protein XAP5 CIRCADIAN TIMEKEEPER n=1 Tax=Camellia lanceoleosa TaxID=1840588 RepID=A0ACC0IRT4_9ERIC|nr:Protein XAP5 CIRCADIAN TIMEKEEPER [Camellia lanceoleosa]